MGLNSTLATGARFAGPLLAGLLVATVGIGWRFIANGLTFIALPVALRTMDAAALRVEQPVARQLCQVREGLRYVWSSESLRVPMLLVAVVGTLAFNFPVLLSLLATRQLNGDGAPS